ncbi:MFS transporter [Bacteroides sp. 224]|uniref:MFS transporter n=1 Tax=Bacteroides sp. 224 TaxID=2302936 RepID=UPI0013D60BBB|nr:MFS transporter [Bacteroides sp. 224]NDV66895.1 MFS transporter [Bacteroides sp. 224]
MSSPLRICWASMLLFASQYMLLPILPAVLAINIGLSVVYAGMFMLLQTLGMLLVGPFHGFLIDTYRRKYIGLISFFVLTLVSAGYYYANSFVEFLLLPLLHGIALGLAYLSLTTICIDVTASGDRDRINKKLGGFVHLGIILGVALGSFLSRNNGDGYYGFLPVMLVSIGLVVWGALSLISVPVPFRAPIGMPVCSLDRFFLPRTWVLTLNVVLVSFVFGIFLPLIYWDDRFMVDTIIIPYLTVAGVGFLLLFFFKSILKRIDVWKLITTSIVLIVVAISVFLLFDQIVLRVISAFLLGIALEVVGLTFLFMFVDLSHHCQRVAANNSYLIAWQLGVSVGIAVACYLCVNKQFNLTFQLAMFSATIALIFFLLVTYPYYKKRKRS